MPKTLRSIFSNHCRPKLCRSLRPERRALFVLACAAGTACAQAPVTVATEPPPCGSVVVVRCDRQKPAASSSEDAVRQLEARRRGASDPLELERIVIEADPLRRSVEEAMAGAFAAQPAYGTHTFTTAEGSQCSCMNRCPPFPFPCCQCSAHMSRYSVSPGASPLR